VTDRRSLLDPSELTPLALDLRRVFWAFIAAWGAALVLTIALAAAGSVPSRAVAICATGLGLGFLALAWERWRFGPRRDAAAPGDASAPADADDAGDPPTAGA
jgi:hypothetical protein